MAIPGLMRAAWYERTGPARDVLVVGEVETPEPGPGEVLLRVAASGVNPHDTKRRAGWFGQDLPAQRVIPHSDAAGVIVEIGKGVDREWCDERVWAFRADSLRAGQGTAAEYVAVPMANAFPVPDSVPLELGAALGVPGLTAFETVFADGPVKGKTVLVHGGAGAVSCYAIQLAKHGGARVLATVSSPQKAELARAVGADAVIDYRSEDEVQRVLELSGGPGVDRIIEVDFSANITKDIEMIRPHGVIASYASTRDRQPLLPYYPLAYKGVMLRFVQGMLLPEQRRREGARMLNELMSRGRLQHPALYRFPLERIAEAHEAMETGAAVGKIVIDLTGPG